jgi:hypothetical protein
VPEELTGSFDSIIEQMQLFYHHHLTREQHGGIALVPYPPDWDTSQYHK